MNQVKKHGFLIKEQNMAKEERKKDPIQVITRYIIIFALLALVAYGITYAVDASQKATLEQQQKAALERNAQAETNYQMAMVEYNQLVEEAQTPDIPEVTEDGWVIMDWSNVKGTAGNTQVFSRSEILSQSPLMVTNRWHALPMDYYENVGNQVVSLMEHTERKVPTSDSAVQIMPQAADALASLIEQATSEELKYTVYHTGYRSYEKQNEFYENEKAKHPTLEGVTLEEKILEKVNAPGTSEFQTGYAFELGLYAGKDKVDLPKNIQTSEQAKWLNQNGWKNGIIFRFPTKDFPGGEWIDKSVKTGVKANYNFYRFVGIPHATVMQGIAMETGDAFKQMVLEEYIDYLMEHNHIAVYFNKQLKYEIFRIQLLDPQAAEVAITFPVGNYAEPMVSYDNMGGVIVAITHN